MSIFDNIVFDEFTLLEGEQAEAYKKRKAEEKIAKEKAEKERDKRRYEMKDGSFFSTFNPTGAKKHYNTPYFKSSEEDNHIYKGKGKRSDYPFVSNEDDKIRDKSEEIFNKEKNKRKEEWDIAHDELKKVPHPGERPKGVFKGKEKKEYDKKLADYKYKRENLHNNEVNKYKQYANLKDNPSKAIDAASRHIRRHPKQYKESVFEDIEMI